jgi:hypothetical protein
VYRIPVPSEGGNGRHNVVAIYTEITNFSFIPPFPLPKDKPVFDIMSGFIMED